MKTQLKLSSAPISAMIENNPLEVISFEKQGYEVTHLEKWEDLNNILNEDQLNKINNWFKQYTHSRIQKDGRAAIIYRTIALGESEYMSKTLYVNVFRKGNDIKIICENILPINNDNDLKEYLKTGVKNKSNTKKFDVLIDRNVFSLRKHIGSNLIYRLRKAKDTHELVSSREIGKTIKIDLLKEAEFFSNKNYVNSINNLTNAIYSQFTINQILNA